MGIFGKSDKNGESERSALRLARLSEVLSYSPEAVEEPPPPVAEAPSPPVQEEPPPEPAAEVPDRIEQAARDIAGALVGTVAAALGEARRRNEAGRPSLEAAADCVTQLSAAQAQTTYAVETLTSDVAGLDSRLLQVSQQLLSLESAIQVLTSEVRTRSAM